MCAAPIPPLPAPVHELDFAPLRAMVTSFANGVEFEHVPMRGGASTRRYFRVNWDSRSAVAMFVPEGAKAEEVHKHHASQKWPFLEVHALLAERGVRVPKIYAEATDRGWLLLEDLGDDTLANYLLRAPDRKPALYTRAVTDLARAQKSLADLPSDTIVKTRAFDDDLLSWEIHHFREWGLEARGIHLGSEDRALFDGIAERVAREIASWPRGFTHRDYQSRNLMVGDGESLVWIDFQDALLGPRIYDLVALLNDSYQTFDRAFVEARLDEYANEAGLNKEDRVALGREFDIVTVQRKLKDAGRFVFIAEMKNNRSFLPFVEPTIAKARASLERLAPSDPDMAALLALLNRIL